MASGPAEPPAIGQGIPPGPAARSMPPVQHVRDAGGNLVPFDPTRYHVLEEGSVGISGTVIGTGSVRLEDTTVVFTDAQERYFVVRKADDPAVAALVAPQSDDGGRFEVPPIFPAGTPLVATALLARNRRLAAFGLAGEASADITPGTTYVIEFLRDQTGTPEAFGAALGAAVTQDVLRQEGRRADALLAAGALPIPSDGPEGDLVMGNGVRLAIRYLVAVLAPDREASLAWRQVFGKPVRALTTFAGTFRKRFNDGGPASPSTQTGLYTPAGLEEAPDGTVYIAEIEAGRIKQVRDGFISLAAGTTDGDPALSSPTLSPDETPISDPLRLGGVHAVKVDPAGNLALTFADFGNRLQVVGYLCLAAGRYFGRDMSANTFYRLTHPDGYLGYQDGPRAVARFRAPTGLAFDDTGHLYVADRRNNRIRRIDRETGEVSTVLGDGWPWIDAIQTASGGLPVGRLTLDQAGGSGSTVVEVPDFGRLVDQPAGPGSGLRASFNRPLSIAWRRAGDRQELYVYDSYNNVIRRASAPYGGDFRDAEVVTVAGATRSHEHATLGYSVVIGATGPATNGPARQIAFDLARYNPSNRDEAQIVRSGMALDADWDRLYIVDTNNRAIRMLDLAAGTVETIAADSPDRREGDALRSQLSSIPGGLAVRADHNLLFADLVNHVVREIHTRHDR